MVSRTLATPRPHSRSSIRKQIEHALENPIDGDPLSARLKANLKLTIAFDDLSATDQALTPPDPRSIALECALTAAANAQIDDVQVVSARGLSRRMHKA